MLLYKGLFSSLIGNSSYFFRETGIKQDKIELILSATMTLLHGCSQVKGKIYITPLYWVVFHWHFRVAVYTQIKHYIFPQILLYTLSLNHFSTPGEDISWGTMKD